MSQDIPQQASRFEDTYRPTARTRDLVATYADGKALLYDMRLNHIHHLDAEVTAVWHHCDGHSTVAMISAATKIHGERVRVALDDLSQRNLLVEEVPSSLRVSRINRRKMAKLGLATLPAIVSVSAPAAADSDSQATIACIPYNTRGCSISIPCCTDIVPTAFCLDGDFGDGLCN